eukprot:COSAG02_NODE_2425_length_8891_cov_48.519791_7_plen_59_part_00
MQKTRGNSGTTATAATKSAAKYCDEDGHYLWVKNERLEDRCAPAATRIARVRPVRPSR